MGARMGTGGNRELTTGARCSRARCARMRSNGACMNAWVKGRGHCMHTCRKSSPLVPCVAEPDVHIRGRGPALAPQHQLSGPMVQVPQRNPRCRCRCPAAALALLEGFLLVLQELPPVLRRCWVLQNTITEALAVSCYMCRHGSCGVEGADVLQHLCHP